MAKQCLRFGKLFLDYLGVTEFTPEEFSEYLRDWRSGGVSVNALLGGPQAMEMLLKMIFKKRHRLKKDILNPNFDSLAFFLEYQLNLPLVEAPLFGSLFRDLPPDVYKEMAEASMSLGAVMFQPQQSVWSDPGLFGDRKVELSPEPKPKPKPLPTPTHKAPSTLQ